MAGEPVDLLVVGGGINGAGIARDAAGRGLKVCLVEKDDLASHTSSWSSKLIHGGLRYLEYYEFRLVREALIEREVLLRAAPHIISPLTFVLPHGPGMRPAWMLRLGLFLYDHLGGRELLPGSTRIDLSSTPEGTPLKSQYKTGFTYSDGWVDDSRLVALNARDAADRGAEILTRTCCTAARRENGQWVATLETKEGHRREIRARGLVNAAGPWVQIFLDDNIKKSARHRVRLVKGSHIVVPRLFEHDRPYILQNDDKRIVFAIPYYERFTLIGTTDVPFEGDPGEVRISRDEIDYLCGAVNRYFERQTTPEDIVWSFAGVRPLYDDASGNPSAVTRDYVFDLDTEGGGAPLLSIFGGKITTYRKLAEHALERLTPVLKIGKGPWTAKASLPGGDIADADFGCFLEQTRRARPWVPAELITRLAHAYGTRIDRVLGEATDMASLGEPVAPGLYAAELDYLVREEWARTAEDVLWRRSKLGLFLDAPSQARVHEWFAVRAPDTTRAAEKT
ncbi:glycerol-3-phosphate dehydrogenase [Geminicoccaceae bacterium 1502E]|nr:glycerol-3-phosphate dehydrogenase [Geminicoccaceae bacterium 1502E]